MARADIQKFIAELLERQSSASRAGQIMTAEAALNELFCNGTGRFCNEAWLAVERYRSPMRSVLP